MAADPSAAPHVPSPGPSAGAVPVIDLREWTSGDADRRASLARDVDRACSTVGFMQVVGHGIPDAVVAGLGGAIDEFFDQPLDVKRRSLPPRPSVNRGYTEPGSERLSYSLGVESLPDLFEAFNVGASVDDHPGLDLDPEIYARNIWPDDLPSFRDGVTTWFAHARGVAHTMTDVFATALGLPDGWFRAFTDHSIDVLRLNHYPLPAAPPDGAGPTRVEPPLEPGQLGMGAHTDYGIVTVLWADPVPGLEVLSQNGTWVPVVPQPGALLINLGDLLARWTNDRWTSTMHRVVPPRDEASRPLRRRSAAFFHDGNADALIGTIATCRAPDGSSTYEPVTVGEHLAQKLAGSRGLTLNDHAGREAGRLAAAEPGAHIATT